MLCGEMMVSAGADDIRPKHRYKDLASLSQLKEPATRTKRQKADRFQVRVVRG